MYLHGSSLTAAVTAVQAAASGSVSWPTCTKLLLVYLHGSYLTAAVTAVWAAASGSVCLDLLAPNFC